jgi:hypothetical protein
MYRRTRCQYTPLTEHMSRGHRHSQSVFWSSVFGTWQDYKNSYPTVRPGKIGGRMKMTGRWGRRRKQLLDEVKEKRRYWELKREAPDRTLWRTYFGKCCGPVIRQTAGWMAATITTELHSEWNTRTCRLYYAEPCVRQRDILRLMEIVHSYWHLPGVRLLATLLLSVGEHYYFTNVIVVDG